MSLQEIRSGFEFVPGLFCIGLRGGYLYGAWPRTLLILIEKESTVPELWQLVVFCCRILPEGLKSVENFPIRKGDASNLLCLRMSFVVLFIHSDDADWKLTENAIDARAIPQLEGGGAKIGSFLKQNSINCCIVTNRWANFRGDRGVSYEMMRMNRTPYQGKWSTSPYFPLKNKEIRNWFCMVCTNLVHSTDKNTYVTISRVL